MSQIASQQELLTLLDTLIQQARRHDRQWVQPLKRIHELIEQKSYAQGHVEWLQLLQPMRGSFHEFFIYCNDLDQMRELNRQLDEARQNINVLMSEMESSMPLASFQSR